MRSSRVVWAWLPMPKSQQSCSITSSDTVEPRGGIWSSVEQKSTRKNSNTIPLLTMWLVLRWYWNENKNRQLFRCLSTVLTFATKCQFFAFITFLGETKFKWWQEESRLILTHTSEKIQNFKNSILNNMWCASVYGMCTVLYTSQITVHFIIFDVAISIC